MKSIDFLDEWNKTHTSSPSFQDVLDWAEKEHTIEMKELNANWMMTLGVQKQGIINKACKWFEKNLPDMEYITNASAYRQSKSEFIDTFRKAMEEEL